MSDSQLTPFEKVEAPALKIDALLYPDGRISANGKLERRIVANLFAFLAAKGWAPTVVDDSEEQTTVSSAVEAMELIFDLDEVNVLLSKGDSSHWVFLVLGNGIDIIADYGYTDGDLDGFNATMSAFDAEDYE